MPFVRTALTILVAMTGLGVAPADPPVLIRGARVFDGSGSAATVRDVLVRGGQIAAVGRRLRAPTGARVIDATGLTLLPGLHDLHIHTGRQAFQSPEGLASGYAGYLLNGVTTVDEFSTGGDMLAGIRELAPMAQAPHINLAVRLGVPEGHGTESEFTQSITRQVTTPAEAHVAMAEALSFKPDLIKVFADGWRYGRDPDRASMDLPTLKAIVDDAHRAKLPVLTHTVTLAGAKIAARAGVDALAHGIGDAPVDAELIALMKRHDTSYIATLVVYEPQQDRAFLPAEWQGLRTRDRAREEQRLANPIEPILPYDSRRWQIMQDNIRALQKAGIRIAIGTDTGIGGVYPGSAALREVLWLTKLGLSPAQALRAATSVSARVLSRRPDHGRIAKGQRADLVLTGGAPDRRIEDLYDVRRVLVNGREIDLPAARAAFDIP